VTAHPQAAIASRLTTDAYLRQGQTVRSYEQHLRDPVALHWHEFHELQLVVNGTGRETLNGTEHLLRRGGLTVLSPADFHAITPLRKPLRLYDVVFTEAALDEVLESLLFATDLPYTLRLEGPGLARVERAFAQLHEDTVRGGLAVERLVRADFDRVVIEIARQRGAISAPPVQADGDFRRVRPGLVFLHHHFRQQLTLADVASRAHLSPRYFSECFHRATGKAFQHYLVDLRLGFARRLLEITNLPIRAICEASGFGDLSHFERMFRREHDCSPRDYQRRTIRS
jgi:AraC-like DNA-binding protein